MPSVLAKPGLHPVPDGQKSESRGEFNTMSGDYWRQTQSWLGEEKGRRLRHHPLTVSVPSSSIFRRGAACRRHGGTQGRGEQRGRNEPCPSLTSPQKLPELRVRGSLSYQRPVASQLAPSPNQTETPCSPALSHLPTTALVLMVCVARGS